MLMIRNLTLGAAALAAMFAFGASANAVTFQTPIGSTVTDGSVDASATFTMGTDGLTLVLTDLLQNPKSSGQTISGISFAVSGAVGSPSLTSAMGPLSTINSGGTYTIPSGSSPLTHWGTTVSPDGTTTLTGGQPYQLIVGPDSAGGFTGAGKYSNANNGFDNFNPYVLGSATFDIFLSGVLSNSKISDVVFQFGTQAGSNLVTGVCSVGCPNTSLPATPLPASLPLLATGLGVMGLLARRRKRKKIAGLTA